MGTFSGQTERRLHTGFFSGLKKHISPVLGGASATHLLNGLESMYKRLKRIEASLDMVQDNAEETENPPAPTTGSATFIRVADPGGIITGRLVNYIGSTLSYATFTDAALYATHLVSDVSGGFITLRARSEKARLQIDPAATAGMDTPAVIWLMNDGQVTIRRADVFTSDGGLQTGVAVGQAVGFVQGLVGTSPPGGQVWATFSPSYVTQ